MYASALSFSPLVIYTEIQLDTIKLDEFAKKYGNISKNKCGVTSESKKEGKGVRKKYVANVKRSTLTAS